MCWQPTPVPRRPSGDKDRRVAGAVQDAAADLRAPRPVAPMDRDFSMTAAASSEICPPIRPVARVRSGPCRTTPDGPRNQAHTRRGSPSAGVPRAFGGLASQPAPPTPHEPAARVSPGTYRRSGAGCCAPRAGTALRRTTGSAASQCPRRCAMGLTGNHAGTIGEVECWCQWTSSQVKAVGPVGLEPTTYGLKEDSGRCQRPRSERPAAFHLRKRHWTTLVGSGWFRKHCGLSADQTNQPRGLHLSGVRLVAVYAWHRVSRLGASPRGSGC